MTAEIQAITMPKWGLAMEEGKVVAWETGEGEAVAAGQEILEIETTKITNVFESPAGGILRRCVVQEGVTVPVGGLLGVVAAESVPEAEIEAFIERFQAEFAVAAEAAAESGPSPEVVEAGGHRINYLRAGEGPPLLLIHGFGGDLNNWLFNQPALAEHFTVYALDLPGHGASSKAVGDGSIEVLSGAVRDFAAALGLDAAHLAGHSLGGAIAALCALKRAPEALSLTLIAPGGLGPEINPDYVEGFVAAGKRKEMKPVLEALVADPALISRDMVNEVLKYKRLDGVAEALRRIADRLFAGGQQGRLPLERLVALDLPVQVIWGAADRVIPASQAEGLPSGIKVTLLDAVGHMPHMEAAAEVNRLIAEIAG